VRRVRADAEVVPDRRPEAFQVADGPVEELLVCGEVEPSLLSKPILVATELRLPAHLLRGRPDDLPLRERHPAWTIVPPSTRYAAPVMKLEAGEASSSTSPFSSSGLPMRPRGTVRVHIRSSSAVGFSVTPPPIL